MQHDFLETPHRALAAAAASAGVDGGKRVFLYLQILHDNDDIQCNCDARSMVYLLTNLRECFFFFLALPIMLVPPP